MMKIFFSKITLSIVVLFGFIMILTCIYLRKKNRDFLALISRMSCDDRIINYTLSLKNNKRFHEFQKLIKDQAEEDQKLQKKEFAKEEKKLQLQMDNFINDWLRLNHSVKIFPFPIAMIQAGILLQNSHANECSIKFENQEDHSFVILTLVAMISMSQDPNFKPKLSH